MARSVIRGGDFTIRRDYERLGAAQRRRYERAGITRRAYESGASLQRARGHRRHEHRTRAERNPQALTSTEYRFLKKQQQRSGINFLGLFRQLSHTKRQSMMQKVASLNREYKRQHGRSGVVVGKGGEQVMRPLVDEIVYSDDDYPDLDEFEEYGALLFYH